MEYRCPKCKKIFEGEVKVCPHCGVELHYKEDTKAETIVRKKYVDRKSDLTPGRVKGPYQVFNVLFMFGCATALLCGLFLLFAPYSLLIHYLPYGSVFSFAYGFKELVFFLSHIGESWLFMGDHPFAYLMVLFDMMIFGLGLSLVTSSIYPLIKSIVAFVTNEPFAFANPKTNTKRRFGFVWVIMIYGIFTTLLLVGRFFLDFHPADPLTNNLTLFASLIYIPVTLFLFFGISLVIFIATNILSKNVKVVN